MSENVIIAIIAIIPILVSSIGGFIISILTFVESRKTTQMATESKEQSIINTGIATQTRDKMDNVHLQINSRMDELIDVTKIASHAVGLAEGIKEEKDRDKTKDE